MRFLAVSRHRNVWFTSRHVSRHSEALTWAGAPGRNTGKHPVCLREYLVLSGLDAAVRLAVIQATFGDIRLRLRAVDLPIPTRAAPVLQSAANAEEGDAVMSQPSSTAQAQQNSSARTQVDDTGGTAPPGKHKPSVMQRMQKWLDPALLRAGRFDRRVTVPAPDKTGREAILKVHTRGVPLAADVNLKEVAAATPGLVGADLRNLVNEAALLAARRQEARVSQREFFDSLEKIVLGPARGLLLDPGEKRRVAYHESGHSVLGLVVPGADPVKRVTIVPRGQALGVTYQQPEDDRHNYEEAFLRARIIGAMGGRAAEEVVYDGRTTGAENDIQQATDLARQMVTRWGMSDTLGPIALGGRENPYLPGDVSGGQGGKPYSETFATLIDTEVQRIAQDNYTTAVQLLRTHRAALDALAAALVEHETLDEDEILKVTGFSRAQHLHEPSKDGRAVPVSASSAER